MEKASHRLLQLINDVLDLSKLRAGRMEINAERTKLHDVLEEAIQTIEPLAGLKRSILRLKKSKCRRYGWTGIKLSRFS